MQGSKEANTTIKLFFQRVPSVTCWATAYIIRKLILTFLVKKWVDSSKFITEIKSAVNTILIWIHAYGRWNKKIFSVVLSHLCGNWLFLVAKSLYNLKERKGKRKNNERKEGRKERRERERRESKRERRREGKREGGRKSLISLAYFSCALSQQCSQGFKDVCSLLIWLFFWS